MRKHKSWRRYGRGLLASVVVAAVGALGLPVTQSASAQQQADVVYGGVGWLTQLRGGGVAPVNSGKTGLSYLGCTEKIGAHAENGLANINLGPDVGNLVQIDGSTTDNDSVQRANGDRGSRTVTNVADINVGLEGVLGINLTGVRTVARAFQKANGNFATYRDTDIGGASLMLAGEELNLPVQTILEYLITPEGIDLSIEGLLRLLGDADVLLQPEVLGALLGELPAGPLVNTLIGLLNTLGVDAVLSQIGGLTALIGFLADGLADTLPIGDASLGTIRGDLGWASQGPRGARIFATGIRIDLLDINGEPASLLVGRAHAKVYELRQDRPTLGYAYAAKLDVLEGVVGTGKIANQPLECHGTSGKWMTNHTADVTVPGLASVKAASSRTFSGQMDNGAINAHARSSVANVNLLGGQVKIQGLHTNAHVRRRPNGSRLRSTEGTTLGKLELGGQVIDLNQLVPDVPLVIPGVAEVTFAKVVRKPYGMEVTGLEIKLLSGQLVTLEIGKVQALVR